MRDVNLLENNICHKTTHFHAGFASNRDGGVLQKVLPQQLKPKLLRFCGKLLQTKQERERGGWEREKERERESKKKERKKDRK